MYKYHTLNVSMDNYADYKIAYFSAQELCESPDGLMVLWT